MTNRRIQLARQGGAQRNGARQGGAQGSEARQGGAQRNGARHGGAQGNGARWSTGEWSTVEHRIEQNTTSLTMLKWPPHSPRIFIKFKWFPKASRGPAPQALLPKHCSPCTAPHALLPKHCSPSTAPWKVSSPSRLPCDLRSRC
ncbi:hypothetical protein FHG87_011832 [Trinorchestia longiramus]|nr:hypothetical protein FHG87_011832 [Trinorchestia longiramus]